MTPRLHLYLPGDRPDVLADTARWLQSAIEQSRLSCSSGDDTICLICRTSSTGGFTLNCCFSVGRARRGRWLSCSPAPPQERSSALLLDVRRWTSAGDGRARGESRVARGVQAGCR